MRNGTAEYRLYGRDILGDKLFLKRNAARQHEDPPIVRNAVQQRRKQQRKGLSHTRRRFRSQNLSPFAFDRFPNRVRKFELFLSVLISRKAGSDHAIGTENPVHIHKCIHQ